MRRGVQRDALELLDKASKFHLFFTTSYFGPRDVYYRAERFRDWIGHFHQRDDFGSVDGSDCDVIVGGSFDVCSCCAAFYTAAGSRGSDEFRRQANS